MSNGLFKVHMVRSSYYIFWGAILTFLMTGVFVTSVFAVSSTCNDIVGSTNPLDSPITDINEGQMLFGSPDATSPGNNTYEACMEDQDDILDDRLNFEGWVENTNLGWISLKSEDEDEDGTDPYQNTGIDNGDYEYESYLHIERDADGVPVYGDELGAPASVPTVSQLFGYWWGDNMGWLRLNCKEYSDSGDNYCATSDHRVTVASVSAGMAQLEGYAWSDNVGWVNFDGVELPIDDSMINVVVNVVVVPVRNVGGGWVETEDPIYANSDPNAGYSIYVEFYNESVAPANRLSAADYELCFIWKDGRYLETPGDPLQPNDCTQHFTRFGGPSMNSYDEDVFALTGSGERLVLDPGFLVRSFVPTVEDELSLKRIVFSKMDGGDAVYGDEIDLVDMNFAFDKPFEEVMYSGTLDECPVGDVVNQLLEVTLGLGQPVNLCGNIYKGAISGSLVHEMTYNLSGGPADDLLTAFLFSPTEDVCAVGDRESISYNAAGGSADFAAFPYLYFPSQCAEEGDEEEEEPSPTEVDLNSTGIDANISTTVSYNIPGGTVVRPGPTLENGFFSIGAAQVKGNVQSNAVQLFKEDIGFRTSGGQSRSVTREAVLKRVTDFVKGHGIACRFTSDNPYNPVTFNLNNCEVGDTNLYLVEFTKSYFDAGNPLQYIQLSEYPAWFGEDGVAGSETKTLAVVGANLIVDDNMFRLDDSGNYDVDSAYGVVTMRNTVNEGGNIYVTSNVTDIRGYVYADGALFSVVDEDQAFNADAMGIPNRLSENRNFLYSQLTIVGQLISKNTFGGAVVAIPRLGDGSLTNDRELARNYDLNFWRYSPLKLDWREDPSGTSEEGLIYSCSDINPWSQQGFPPDFFFANVPADDLEQHFCWSGNIGGVEVETSKYLDNVAGQPEESERKPVNILFADRPGELSIFGEAF